MVRYSNRNVADAQSIVNKYNRIRAHVRNNFTFDELEKLYICETGIDFPAPTDHVLQDSQIRRGGPLRDVALALEISKRYADKRPNEIRSSLRRHEHQRYIARCQQQQALALVRSNIAEPHFGSIQGQSMNMPLQINFNSGFQNPFEQLPASHFVQPMDDHTILQEPIEPLRVASENDIAIDPILLGIDPSFVAPMEDPATVADGANHNGILGPVMPALANAPALIPDVPAETQPTSSENIDEEGSTYGGSLPPPRTEADEAWVEEELAKIFMMSDEFEAMLVGASVSSI